MSDSQDFSPQVTKNLYNCWEFKKCGREPGGAKVTELGICSATTEQRLDGINGGRNAGRACWIVAGTYCKGQIQGSFAQKQQDCRRCDFYALVKAENFETFEATETLMKYVAASEAEEKTRYYQILRNMVDPSVLQEAISDLDKLVKGEERRITAFFSDITGFSAISEELNENDLSAFLNEYLTEMTSILKKEYGTLDKYIGDAIVGIFGAPVALDSTALHSARASLAMQEKIRELKAQWQNDNRWCAKTWDLHIRIGLCTGLAKVGFMGTSDLASYSMVGLTVNLAKRLERVCRYYGVGILVCEETRKELDETMVLRAIDRIKVEGMKHGELVTIYQLIDKKDHISDMILQAIDYYEKALKAYDRGLWLEAERLFLLSRSTWTHQALLIDRLIFRCVKNRLTGAGKALDPYPVGGAVHIGS
jgi:class 3 adenylate cyclase